MTPDQIIPLALAGIGLYLAWFGVHYWGSDTRWPSDPVKAVLTGKSIPVPKNVQTAADIAAGVEAGANVQSGAPTAAAPGTAGNSAPGVAGGTYTHATLMTLWTLNGGSPSTANIAAAIALAESSGRSTVTSANPDGGTNVGLWQLDTKGKGAGYTIAQLQNPDTNARVTVFGSANGTNWSAWETYANGNYNQFLS